MCGTATLPLSILIQSSQEIRHSRRLVGPSNVLGGEIYATQFGGVLS